MRPLSLAVVGAQYPNKGKSPTRRFGIGLCQPGDPIELVREPKHEADENAIAVFGHDIQLGYVRSERAAFLAPMLDRGRIITAIFQEPSEWGCVIRIAFDADDPVLPTLRRSTAEDDDSGFYPDPIWPDD